MLLLLFLFNLDSQFLHPASTAKHEPFRQRLAHELSEFIDNSYEFIYPATELTFFSFAAFKCSFRSAIWRTFYSTLIGAKQRAVSQPLIYAFRTTISEPKQAAFKRTFRRTKWSTKRLSKRAAIGGAVRAPERVSLADEHAVREAEYFKCAIYFRCALFSGKQALLILLALLLIISNECAVPISAFDAPQHIDLANFSGKAYFALHSNILYIPQCSCLNFNSAVCDPEHPTEQLTER